MFFYPCLLIYFDYLTGMSTQLYTLTTIVLVLQVIYYEHLMSWWKKRGVEVLFPEVSYNN